VKAGGVAQQQQRGRRRYRAERVDTYFVSSITICTLALSRTAAGAA